MLRSSYPITIKKYPNVDPISCFMLELYPNAWGSAHSTQIETASFLLTLIQWSGLWQWPELAPFQTLGPMVLTFLIPFPSSLGGIVFLFICLFVYFYHWNLELKWNLDFQVDINGTGLTCFCLRSKRKNPILFQA